MATRLSYALPTVRQLALSAGRRLRSGGLASTLPQPADERPFFIVTGTGRSGTSAVARVLHESGLSMGEHFRTPTQENPTGFYEELPVCDLNDRIMAECGMAGLRLWPWRSTVLAVAERHGTLMDGLLPDESVAGWKDPRFSVTLEAWLPHLPRRPKLIVCLRSSEAFFHSVAQIFGLMRRDLVERWWANELRRLLAVVRDYRLEATCVLYDDLVQRPQETVAALSAFTGHPLDPAFVEPTLRHFAYTVPQRYAALYEEVRALGAEPSSRERRVRPRKREPLTEAGVRAIEGYLRLVQAVESRVAESSAAWSERVDAPRLTLAHYQELGLEQSAVFDESREASAAHIATVSEAQAELGSLVPPAGFERYHEAVRDAVNGERLVAQLTLQAAEGQRPPDDVLRAYQRYLSPKALAKSEKLRRREYERARKSSGYRDHEPDVR